ncbi:MAG: hypothetical protein CMJ23_01505 [Phycisphaerae bacterium]|nr:hypothetical protein [Phycisphaerae bacterium]
MSTPLKGLVIGRTTGRCAATDRELVPGEPCFTALVRPIVDPEAPAGRGDRPMVDRLDYDPEAWEGVRSSGALEERLLCWWRTEVPEAGGRRNLFVDDETLVDLFARLEEESDPGRQAFRFVLGLILLRRRRLRMIGRDREGDDDIWRFKRVGGGEDAPIWSVTDPRLAEEDAEAIADQLSTILSDEG